MTYSPTPKGGWLIGLWGMALNQITIMFNFIKSFHNLHLVDNLKAAREALKGEDKWVFTQLFV